MRNTMSISELMRILKPVKTCGFMDMCAAYSADIKQSKQDGETSYEIAGINTKSGHPHTIEF